MAPAVTIAASMGAIADHMARISALCDQLESPDTRAAMGARDAVFCARWRKFSRSRLVATKRFDGAKRGQRTK